MLAPCIICNSFYLITWSFLPSFSLSPSFLPSPWQTENLAVQKLFLPIIGKVLKHNWKNVVIPVTTVFFFPCLWHEHNQTEWHVWDESSYLVPLNAMAEEEKNQSFLPLRADRIWNTKQIWRIRAASFYIMRDPIQDHKAHFLKIKTKELTIFCSAPTLSGQELSSAELCSKIVATLLQTPEEPYCFLLSSSKMTCYQTFHPQRSSAVLGGNPTSRS